MTQCHGFCVPVGQEGVLKYFKASRSLSLGDNQLVGSGKGPGCRPGLAEVELALFSRIFFNSSCDVVESPYQSTNSKELNYAKRSTRNSLERQAALSYPHPTTGESFSDAQAFI